MNLSARVRQFQSSYHKIKELVQAVKTDVFCQRSHIIKKILAPRQGFTN